MADGLVMRKLFIIPALPILVAATAMGQNLVGNGGFEAGYNVGWNHLVGGTANGVFSQETTDPYEGARALKVQVNSLGGNSWDVQTLGPSLSLTVGEEYSLTLWGKAAAAGTSVRMVMQNSQWLSHDVNLGASWQPYTWNFTAAESSPRLIIHYFETGTLWLDDIRIEPVVVNTNPVDIVLSPDIRHQTMVGFGGALSWYSSWVYHGNAANDAALEQLMFDDLGLDVVRLKNWYYPNNYPDNTAASSMPEQESFDANQDFYDAAKTINPDIQVLLSSWSPPASLKSNGERENGGTLKSDAGGYMYEELGQYWADALDHMGWTPDYLSIQNEPGYSATWESCILRPTETASNAGYAEAADAVWNAIKDRPDVPLMLGTEAENIGTATWPDWNGGSSVNTFNALNTPLLSRPYIAAHGYHTYNVWNTSQIDNISAELNMVRDSFGDRPNWMTEYSKDDFDWLEAARMIHNAVVEADTSAYIYWKLVWADSPDTMIGIDWNGNYTINDHYYTLKHYAKYVDKGYQRFEVSGGNNDLKVSGYISPEGTNITLVAINKSAFLQRINLMHDALPIIAAQGYRSVSNNFFQTMAAVDVSQPVELPAESMMTLVLGLSESINPFVPDPFNLFEPVFSNNAFSVQITDQPGALFTLWKTEALDGVAWAEVTNATQEVDGDTIMISDPDPGAGAGFYRVQAR